MIKPFPKIFHLGDRHISSIFDEEVEITEKIDGSQIVWKRVGDKFYIRSKGAFIYDGDHFVREIKENDLFYPAVTYLLANKNHSRESFSYYGETLCKPKHSTLTYNKVPNNNIVLFAILDDEDKPLPWLSNNPYNLNFESGFLDIDIVPRLWYGKKSGLIRVSELIDDLLKKESYLGGPKIEGVVVKNYKEYFVGGELLPIMSGKYVSEAFKEVHSKSWTGDNTGKGKWGLYKESFRTEARWNKAIQYLKENGELTDSTKDIGPIIKRINQDIIEEEKENIMNKLWTEFGKDVLREATKGFPEWFKKKLMKTSNEI